MSSFVEGLTALVIIWDKPRMILRRLTARFPLLEVGIRHAYWRVSWLHAMGQVLRKLRPTRSAAPSGPVLPNVKAALHAMGLKRGDTLILHSSTRAMVAAGHSLDDILAMFLELLGEEGTLILPLFPIFEEEPPAEKRFDMAHYQKPFVYRVGGMKIWTGRLPQLLAKRPGARISEVPINPVVAFGSRARRIVANDANGLIRTPCGSHTPWAAMLDLNTKILMLDVDVAHSLTMIHVAEDLFTEEWPIEGWYRERQFRVITAEGEHEIHLQERDPKWALFYCEGRLNRDLQAEGIFQHRTTPEGISVALGETVPLTAFLRSKRPTSYPYLIPSRYRKT